MLENRSNQCLWIIKWLKQKQRHINVQSEIYTHCFNNMCIMSNLQLSNLLHGDQRFSSEKYLKSAFGRKYFSPKGHVQNEINYFHAR